MSDDEWREAPHGPSAMLTVQEISEHLGLSERHIRREIKRRRLVAHRFGRLVRISAADLAAYVAARRRGPR